MRSLALLTLAFSLSATAADTGIRPPQVREELFRPIDRGGATLSPDGRHFAYSDRTTEGLFVTIVNVDHPGEQKRILVAPDEVEPMSGDKYKSSNKLTFLRWAKPGRLIIGVDTPFRIISPSALDLPVFRPDPNIGQGWLLYRGAVFAVDADGGNVRVLADPNIVGEEREKEKGSEAVNPALEGISTPDKGTSRSDVPGAEGAGSAIDGARQTQFLPREPRVVALPPDQPDFVIVEGNGTPSSHGVFRIHADTAKVKADEYWFKGELLFNKAGLPAILREQPDGPREIFHRLWTAKGVGAGVELDRELRSTPPLNFQVSPENYLGARSFPIATDYDPNILYYASNIGRDTYGIYALNMLSGQRTPFSVEHPGFDLADLRVPFSESPLVFDRARRSLVGVRYDDLAPRTLWRDPDLAGMQRDLDVKFPGQTVEILEWSDDRSRFLLSFSSRSDPGRYAVLFRKEKRLQEIAQLAPWLKTDALNATLSFSFTTGEGAFVTGYLTLPRQTHIKPPALIVKLHDGPWERDVPGFDAEAQAIADMGFVVAQINYRGSAGFGSAHRDAIKRGLDTVPLADVLSAIDWVSERTKIDAKRIAIMGRGFGGYLALRALQLHPDRFRCAVTIDAPTDLGRWLNNLQTDVDFERLDTEIRRQLFGTDRATLRALSPITSPEKLTKPVLLVHDRVSTQLPLQHATALRRAVSDHNPGTEVLEAPSEFTRGVPGAKAAVFSQIQDFLYLNLYDYNVKLGTAMPKD